MKRSSTPGRSVSDRCAHRVITRGGSGGDALRPHLSRPRHLPHGRRSGVTAALENDCSYRFTTSVLREPRLCSPCFAKPRACTSGSPGRRPSFALRSRTVGSRSKCSEECPLDAIPSMVVPANSVRILDGARFRLSFPFPWPAGFQLFAVGPPRLAIPIIEATRRHWLRPFKEAGRCQPRMGRI